MTRRVKKIRNFIDFGPWSHKLGINFFMKKSLFFVVLLLPFILMGNSYAQSKPHDNKPKKRRVVPRGPGHWARSYGIYGDVPVNSRTRDHYRSGLGLNGRAGYGFGKGLSVELDFQYDLLFKEGGNNKLEENKNLLSFAPGLRYTVDLVRDMSWYDLGLTGVTYDYTKTHQSTWNLSYALGTGVGFAITEDLQFGPEVRFRHVLEKELDENDMETQLVSVGVSVTYTYD